MTQVVSRVNGLKIAIPADARNVVHRFAIAGGGNELVFEPLTRKQFDASKGAEAEPMGIGQAESSQPEVAETISLSENVVDDEAPAKKTRKPRQAKAKTEPLTDAEDALSDAEDALL